MVIGILVCLGYQSVTQTPATRQRYSTTKGSTQKQVTNKAPLLMPVSTQMISGNLVFRLLIQNRYCLPPPQ